MCGICGIMNLGPPDRGWCNGFIDRMTETLAHRGPNDRGTWCDDRIALGHRRLSVIDLSEAGRQPMSNEDGSIQIVYNGEVYNFRELKKQHSLVERGHIFRSRTDTEVLIHLYETVGLEKMLPELNGMFAFAIWDAKQEVLYLARDRYGVKPLFYHKDDRCFRFGSEIKAIIADERVSRKPSIQALHDFLSFDYVPGSQTAFEAIYKLPPGHWLRIDTAGNITMRPYCNVCFHGDDSIDESSAVKRARELLAEAVERQLVADVPVGVLLSGGMDSSTLVGLMQGCVSEPVHTYSVGFEDQSFNELPYARTVARKFNTIHREVIVTPDLVRALLPKYLTYIDEPYADGSAIPTYYVCQLAKDDVVVVLSGEGGDEIFAGYETYAAYQVNRWFRKVPHWIRGGLIPPLVNCLPVSDKKLSLEFKLKRFLGGQDLPPAQAHFWWRVVLTEAQKLSLYTPHSLEFKLKRFLGGQDLPPAQAHFWWRVVLTEAQKLSLYTPHVLEQIVPQASDRHFVERFEQSTAKDSLSRLFEIDGSVFLPDDLMVKNDRMSMAHSLEARVPLTDLELTSFMSTVPSRLKLRSLRKKHIMRRAMEGILPAEILNKKKVGLEMPYSQWFKHELKDLMMSYLGPKRVSDTGLFRAEAVQTLVEDHLAGRVDHGRALWGLLNYMMWLELYVPKL